MKKQVEQEIYKLLEEMDKISDYADRFIDIKEYGNKDELIRFYFLLVKERSKYQKNSKVEFEGIVLNYDNLIEEVINCIY